MSTTIDMPSWFKYTYDDFIEKNSEVWTYIKEKLKFEEMIELYAICKAEKEITDGLFEIVFEQFHMYEDDINNFVKSNKYKLLSFNKETADLVGACVKKNNIAQVVEEDLKNLNEIEEKLRSYEKSFGIKFDFVDFECLNKAKKIGKFWMHEKQIVNNGDVYGSEINTIINLFPKTFAYVKENDLDWNLD